MNFGSLFLCALKHIESDKRCMKRNNYSLQHCLCLSFLLENNRMEQAMRRKEILLQKGDSANPDQHPKHHIICKPSVSNKKHK